MKELMQMTKTDIETLKQVYEGRSRKKIA